MTPTSSVFDPFCLYHGVCSIHYIALTQVNNNNGFLTYCILVKGYSS